MGINVNGMNAAVLDSESPEVRVLVGSEVQEKFVTAKVDYFVSKIISWNPEIKKINSLCFLIYFINDIFIF